MPKATFYTHVADPAAFACRLAARAIQSGSVLLWADSPEAAERFDAQLWQFVPESFLPHEIWLPPQPYPQDVPLVIACGSLPQAVSAAAVLNCSPDFWCEAPDPPVRVLEIVGTGLEDLAEARERFKAYRKHGFEIEHFNMHDKA